MILFGLVLACGEKTSDDSGVEDVSTTENADVNEDTDSTEEEQVDPVESEDADPVESEETDPAENEETNPAEEDETNDSSGSEQEYSIDSYQNIYCEDYALRCGVYSSIGQCREALQSWFSSECTIVSEEKFDVCTDWLSGLECSTQGWIDECSTFFTCP